jgi:hypothetical protein
MTAIPEADNLFHVIAKVVADGKEPSEFYLIGSPRGIVFAEARPNLRIKEVAEVATLQYPDGFTLLTAHYNTARLTKRSDPIFRDGCRGGVVIDNTVIELSVKETAPQIFRVLFSRVDGEMAYATLLERVEALERHLPASALE